MNALQPVTFVTAEPPSEVSTSRATQLFDELTLKQAQAIVGMRKDGQAEINLAYLRGDHWQNGAGWVGPRLTAISAEADQATMTEIEKQFVSRNVVAEVTRRQVAGVLGRQLHWKLTVTRELAETVETDPETGIIKIVKEMPTQQEQALINEAEAALVAWWDERAAHTALEQMDAAALNTKRGVLRLYVPPDLRDSSGNLPGADLNTCMNYIYLQHLGTNQDSLDIQFPSATVYTHKSSQRKIGVFTYQEQDELVEGSAATQAEKAELTYLDDAGNTILRVVDNTGNVEEPMVMPLGGRLTMFEMTRPMLITPQVISLQKLLNLSLTMKERNAIVGGFLERIFFNVKWPGTYKDPKNKREEDFIPADIAVGAGVMVNLQGMVVEDKNGNKVVANPSVNYRDPVSPVTFIATEDSAYKGILQETNQLHYLIAGDASSSGESRIQAREAFTQDLHMSASKIEDGARWLLETVLAEASFFAGRAGAFEGLRAYVQAKVDAGPIGPDEMRAAREMKDAELWSTETAQSATGIEDVDAENARIAKERAERAAVDAKNMLAAQKLIDQQNSDSSGSSRLARTGGENGANA